MSSSPSPESKKPDPRLKVTIGDTQRELYMSFGLLNEVASLVGGPDGIPQLSFNPAISTALLELILAERDKRGNLIRPEDESIVPRDLDPEIAEEIIDWAGDHCLDFFVRRFAKSTKLFATRAGELAAAGSSLTFSANSAGKTA